MRHDDLLELLAAANPVPVAAVAGASTSVEAQATFGRILATPVPRPRPRTPILLRPQTALAGVVMVAAIVVGVVATVGPDSRLGAESAAAQALDEAAHVAASAPRLSLSPGDYYFQRSRSVALNTTVTGGEAYSTIATSTREAWFALDGSGRVREQTDDVRHAGPRDRAVWRRLGEPPLTAGDAVNDRLYDTGELATGRLAEADAGRLAGLPHDPEVLLQTVTAEVAGKGRGEDADGLAFRALADLLASPASTPELRANLFEAVALIDGVELLGGTVDDAGRSGVALGLDSSASGSRSRYVVIFDEATSRLLQSKVVLLERVSYADVEPPTVISSTLYLESGRVASREEQPSK